MSSSPQIEVQRITTAEQMAAALEIRRRVFIEEQQVPEAEEIDEHDGDPAGTTTAVHVLATLDVAPVGTARLLVDGDDHGDHDGPGYPHVGRVAVLEEHRHRHVGEALMQALHDAARERGYAGITLGAQLHAIPFYERLRYHARGEVYLDAGIEHRWMDLTF